jgi:hypothetical protein
MRTHDVIRNIFASIVQDVGYHVGWKQLHVLSSTMFNSFCPQVDIVLTIDDIHTVANVVIVDPTHVDFTSLILHNSKICYLNAIQAKERSYRKWHPIDHLFPLIIEVFKCLHKQVDVFLRDCDTTIWSLKGLKGPPLYVLITFLHKKISIMLQKMQTSFILSWVVMIGLVTHKLLLLEDTPNCQGWPITSCQLLKWRDFDISLCQFNVL